MLRRKAFTLADVMACLAIAAALPAIGALFGARERARLASCKSNISRIGKGLGIYMAANKDDWPWLVSDNQWDAPTGAGQATPPSDKTNYNVSGLLFLLVRDAQDANIFICPSTPDKPDPQTRSKGKWHWDFSPWKDGKAEHVSYSYQAPLLKGKETISGILNSSESGLVVLADRSPAYEGLKPDFNWAKAGKDDPNLGLSQNHIQLNMINLLFADLHVGESLGRADCGINNDSIYSAAGLGEDGKPLKTLQGPGSLKLADHLLPTDSFLLGPKKMEK
jgi:hypothetical protein